MQKCIRPCVQTATKEDEHALHLILPEVLEIIKKRTDQHTSFNLTKLRRSISGYSEGTSVDHSGVFGGTQRRCIKIPRSIVDKDLLDLIDKGIKIEKVHEKFPGNLHGTFNFIIIYLVLLE